VECQSFYQLHMMLHNNNIEGELTIEEAD